MAEAAFGVQLRRSRQAAGLSLRQLASKVGYDHSYLSQVERGQRPGSTQLARLCDRELGTGAVLAAAYNQTTPSAQAACRSAASAGTAGPAGPPAPAGAAGPRLMEAARHELATALGGLRSVDEWSAVATTYARDITTTPPAELLPELTADLDLLQADRGSPALTAPATELAVLIALTLTALGRLRSASRWWRTARAAADSSADNHLGSFARAWEATSGLAEHRPPDDLVELADAAVALARRHPDHPTEHASCIPRALASRALALAASGSAASALLALDEFLTATAEIPAMTNEPSLYDWPEYRVCGVESQVHTSLGDTWAAYTAQDRALASCPPGWERAELELQLAQCLVMDSDVAAGLALAMRVLVELPDEWHTHVLYEAAGRVLSAVPGKELGRVAVRDYRQLLTRRPYQRVGGGSSSSWPQG